MMCQRRARRRSIREAKAANNMGVEESTQEDSESSPTTPTCQVGLLL